MIFAVLVGIIACVIPFWGINNLVEGKTQSLLPYALESFSACLLAFLIMFGEIRSVVKAQDWASLDDTMGAYFAVAVVLVVLTVLINLFGYILSRMK